MNKIIFAALLVAILSSSLSSAQRPSPPFRDWITASPDGSLRIIVREQAGRLSYCTTQDGDTVLRWSPLGIKRADADFLNHLQFEGSVHRRIDNWYTMLSGKRRLNHDLAHETELSFRHSPGGRLHLIIRAYNDGVAFRYAFPPGPGSVRIESEATGFSIATGGKAWLQEYGLPGDYTPAYEGWYNSGAVGQPSPDSSGWSFPALFNSGRHWILLSESMLDGHSYASHLAQHCEDGQYIVRGPLTGEALGKGGTNAVSTLPYATPWRLAIIGKNLGAIVESNLVNHLSSPAALADIQWIKPGRSSWSWWGEHNSSKDFASLKKFVDLSAEMGWEYSLVDANWDQMGNGGTIEDLARYAAGRHIGLALWYNSGGAHNKVTEQPRDIMSDPLKRKAEFKKLKQWGIRAVKVDFFGSDKQFILQLYLDILKDAAAAQIMVDFHGCTAPRGWSRTYPNLLSMEAVRGAEQYGWDPIYARRAPEHNTVLVCTRNVVGPMDYTPVTFGDYACCPHTTTNAHELALSVLFETGILHFADRAESYRDADERVKAFMRAVPVAWDDTKFLGGEPGKQVVLARRKGMQWFVAGANGEDAGKNISADLSFLPKGPHSVLILSDGEDDRTIHAEERSLTDSQQLDIRVRARGGFIIWVKK